MNNAKQFHSFIAPLILATAAANLDSCGNPTPVKVKTSVAIIENSDRFKVEIVSTFDDSSAYNSVRTIYLIKDAATGAEYFGLSGVGISELGSHTVNKHSTQDER